MHVLSVKGHGFIYSGGDYEDDARIEPPSEPPNEPLSKPPEPSSERTELSSEPCHVVTMITAKNGATTTTTAATTTGQKAQGLSNFVDAGQITLYAARCSD